MAHQPPPPITLTRRDCNSEKKLVGFYPNFKLRLRWPKQSVRILQMNTTSYGRRPQNIKSGIYQQPLIESYSNLKLKLR